MVIIVLVVLYKTDYQLCDEEVYYFEMSPTRACIAPVEEFEEEYLTDARGNIEPESCNIQ